MKKLVNFLKDWGLLLLAGLALILGIVLSLKGFFIGLFKEQQSATLNTSGSTITDNLANQYADTLHVAMASIGTQFSVVKNVFSEITESDYYKIHNKFGDRGYVDFLGVGIDILYPKLLNLKQWLDSELTSSEKRELKAIAPYLIF
ncbi:hypothetical protein TPENAI_60772 [Tenacibaculum litopenaei]|uniref:hypothetical protein n=1 Tax=Tenacibaculum litopenaei TaxID=396016 RepID=UPI003894E8F4